MAKERHQCDCSKAINRLLYRKRQFPVLIARYRTGKAWVGVVYIDNRAGEVDIVECNSCLRA